MFLIARPLEFESRRPIVFLNSDDADELGLKPMDRIELVFRDTVEVGIINIAEHFIQRGEIGLFRILQEKLNVRMGEKIKVKPTLPPDSIVAIKRKIAGKTLSHNEIKNIINDVVKSRLSDIEMTAFVVGLHNHGMTMSEAASLSKTMASTGVGLNLGKKAVYDKHSIGGVPGDKTSMLLVPTVSLAGLTIPKTSSRAITSPAGTADRVECLCPVNLSIDEIKKAISRENGCLVWGGALDLAPADDAFIKIEYPLSLDPLLLPSIMSKKKAVNAKYLVVDIPTGRGVKFKTIADAEELGMKFIELGRKLGIKVECSSTFAEQPIGYAVGPALEAREALKIADTGRGPDDLINKVAHLAGVLFEFRGFPNPEKKAMKIIRSGRAGKKLRAIMAAQGGNPKLRIEDIPIGTHSVKVKSTKTGKVWWIDNVAVIQVARAAGAPFDKGAGLVMHKKLNEPVNKGDVIFEVYSEHLYKLNRALETVKCMDVMCVGKKYDMVLADIPEDDEEERYFILER